MAYGSILAAACDPAENRKVRGAFFTPRALAQTVADRLVNASTMRVLEPACGEAVFMEAVAGRLHSLGLSERDAWGRIQGIELHGESARAAQQRLAANGVDASIEVADFFEVNPEPIYDVVVGNPPYIRFQNFSGTQRARAQESALALGVRIDSLASSWAPFIIHAARFLRPGGSLGFVLPRELLVANYAAPVRAFLIERFSSVEVDLFEQSVFPEVEEGVLLLLASGYAEPSQTSINVRQVRNLDALANLAPPVTVPLSVADGRWPLSHDAMAAERLLDAVRPFGFDRLGLWGDVRLGAVTGANDFFAMSPAAVEGASIPSSALLRLCPPGSRHLRRLRFSDDQWRRLGDGGVKTLLFYPSDAEAASTRAVGDYLAHGVAEGVNERYKCRARDPWWRVPGLRVCDCFVTCMNGDGPNLCLNEAAVYHLNSVHGLYLAGEGRGHDPEVLALAALSSISQLSAELVGRSYGGGILKLEPREASNLLVPRPGRLPPLQNDGVAASVDKALERGDRTWATRLVDDWLCGILGVGDDVLDDARRLHDTLKAQRTLRSKKGGRRGH